MYTRMRAGALVVGELRGLVLVLALIASLTVLYSGGIAEGADQGSCSGSQTLTINNDSVPAPSPLFGPSAGPYGIAVDGSGNIYAADPTSNTVYRFSPAGTQTLELNGVPSPVFTDPDGVAVDSDGYIYVGNPGSPSSASIQRFNASGTPLGFALGSAPDPDFLNPRGIAVDDSSDIVYFAESGGGAASIYAAPSDLSSVEVLVQKTDPEPDFHSVGGVTVDSVGNLYVAGSFYDTGTSSYEGIVYKFGPSGTQLWTLQDPDFTSGTNGVAVDSAGNVYVSDDGSGVTEVPDGTAAIYGFRPTGERFLTINDSSPSVPAPAFIDPHYLAVDGAGETLYVSDRYSHTIYRFQIECNDPPAAVADPFSIDEDQGLSSPAPGVLGNDSDPEGDPISAELVSGVSHGHLDLQADGSFVYVPQADWWGTDTFTYRAHDGMLYSGAATVTIDVAAVNDPPEVSDSDGPFIIPGHTSCVDIYGSLLGGAWDPDGDPLTAHLYTNATYVDVTVNPDGTWCAPPTGPWPGSDTFQWRAHDGKVYSNVATVHLTTNPMEDQADLSLTKTAMPDPVAVGELLQYTLAVHNSGPDPATQVTITDELSSLVQFKTASAECSQAARVVTCDLGTLAVGATKVLQITVTPVASGPIENIAYANLNEFDLDGELRSSVTVNVQPPPSDPFTDDDTSVFEADIAWMAAMGITKGCNPPDNDEFCPDAVVIRGQMAAFLTRALNLTARLVDPFVDDDDSIFEADIERLAAAAITKGCNPPDNDRFCPDQAVTRGQMAAFLVRALGYTDNGGGNLFIDDDGSIFEGDIDRLGTAGVTMGCNPPANDRFCPNQEVTRGQMAAFLHRALG